MPRNDNSPVRLSAIEQIIAVTLLGRELYGSQIHCHIARASAGEIKIGQNTLYPTLQRLEKNGIIESEWRLEVDANDKRRPCKFYRLSVLGQSLTKDILQLYAKLQEGVGNADQESRPFGRGRGCNNSAPCRRTG